MSTLKVNAIRNTSASSDAITLATDGTATAKISNYPRHNLIINGDFRIAQRSGSMVGITGSTNSGYQALDRWGFSGNWGSGAVNVGQSSDTPNKSFSKSYHVDVTTAYAGANGVTVQLWQKIEAQDLASCGWDYTSSSSYLTLSFWVKSPKTGTHAITLETYDGDSQYRVLTYSVSSANTWEKKSIQIPGGSNVTIDADAQVGMTVYFMMTTGSDYHNTADAWSSSARFGVTGQVNVLDNTANNFYLTGVQLETGSSAKDFDHRSYGNELNRCLRYYYRMPYKSGTFIGVGTAWNTDSSGGTFSVPVPMRTSPTFTVNAGGDFETTQVFGDTQTCSAVSMPYGSSEPHNMMSWRGESSGNHDTGECYILRFKDGQTSGYISLSAEL